MQTFLAKGQKNSNLPHQNVHYSVQGDSAIIQADYTDEEIKWISSQTTAQFYGDYKDGFIEDKKIINNPKGINIPWLQYTTRGKIKHDGYGNGFHDYYFNDKGANDDIKAQLDILRNKNYKYLRLWLNIYHSFNADKETVGYTNYINNFLANLASYCDWCEERGLKLIICIDDCWYTFPWHWLNTNKEASYVQACKDLVSFLKNKPAIWGWDYGNEPYMGWWSSDPTGRTHTHRDIPSGIYGGTVLSYDRNYLTNFYKSLYTELKAINSSYFYSVGDSKPENNGSFDIKSACDFYQCHWYGDDPNKFTYSASQYDKLVIIGEYGWKEFPHATHPEFNININKKFIAQGFKLHIIWSMSQLISKATLTDPYIIHDAL